MRDIIHDLCDNGHITTADREEQLIAVRDAETADWLPGDKYFFSAMTGKYVMWPMLLDHHMNLFEIAWQWNQDDDDGSVSDPIPVIDYWASPCPSNIGMFKRNWSSLPHPVMVPVEPFDEMGHGEI